VLNIATEKSS